ncbi:MAG: 2OG-Fe(II) oxygenase [Deltaproteobacteria bacterium]|nr:MAG: 2OG-Fe(II) oxygenase [Deltaproteobacteria bacterium]
MADFVATETQRRTLFSDGMVAFDVPPAALRAVAARREAAIAEFLADRSPGALCLELLGGDGNEAANAFVRGWIADHGLEVRNDRPGAPARDFYEVVGRFSALRALKNATLARRLRLFQVWYHHEGAAPDGGPDPLAATLVDVFEQFYGALEPTERAALLAEPAARVQLYDAGCFIDLHQDGVETVRRKGVELQKRAVVMCYLSGDWRDGAGGEFECVPGVDREVVLGDTDEDWSARERLAVPPRLGTFVLLDFTRFNDPHLVRPVTDDRFVRTMFGWSFATADKM